MVAEQNERDARRFLHKAVNIYINLVKGEENESSN